jgi:hypothetical protein
MRSMPSGTNTRNGSGAEFSLTTFFHIRDKPRSLHVHRRDSIVPVADYMPAVFCNSCTGARDYTRIHAEAF